jgi:hypothetical protein
MSHEANHTFFTALETALIEVKKRRQDSDLMGAVEAFLDGDIPLHFKKTDPIFYLSRYIATPNYEALFFLDLGKKYQLPTVISQDSKGMFVSNNELKRSLGKMPVTKGMSSRADEIVENFTIIDFSEAQGKSFNNIETLTNVPIIDFHNSLFTLIPPYDVVEIYDEADWIDRNYRDNLVKHYERVLALFIAHGIMMESYLDSESKFVEDVLLPAFTTTQNRFGLRPLIVELIDKNLEMTRNWNGYPSVLYQFIKNQLN